MEERERRRIKTTRMFLPGKGPRPSLTRFQHEDYLPKDPPFLPALKPGIQLQPITKKSRSETVPKTESLGVLFSLGFGFIEPNPSPLPLASIHPVMSLLVYAKQNWGIRARGQQLFSNESNSSTRSIFLQHLKITIFHLIQSELISC